MSKTKAKMNNDFFDGRSVSEKKCYRGSGSRSVAEVGHYKKNMFIQRILFFVRRHPMIVAFLSGLIYSLPFHYEFLFFLSFVGLIVFYFTLCEYGQLENPFRLTFVFSISFYSSLYSWFSSLYPLERFGFTNLKSVVLIIGAIFGLSLLHSFVLSFFVWFVGKLKVKSNLLPFFMSSSWLISETVIGFGQFGVPWGTVAVSQIGFLPMVQTASLFGSGFITLIVSLSSFCFAHFLKTICERGVAKKFLLYTAIIALTLNIATGIVLYYIPVNENNTINVCAIQANISSNEKWEKGNIKRSIEKYATLAEKAASENDLDLILLPESAFTVMFSEDNSFMTTFHSIAQMYNVTIMFGTLYSEGDDCFNSAIALYPDGTYSDRYDKRCLVPFAEGLPYNDKLNYADWLTSNIPLLYDVDLTSSVYVPGDKCSPIILHNGVICSPLICFDSVFAAPSREAVKEGCELFTIMTNDSWYEDSDAVYQHVSHAKLRSIENNRYSICAANTGISFALTPKGDEIKVTEPLVEDTIVCHVGIVSDRTLYTYIGDVPLYLSLLFVVIGVFLFRVKAE